MYQIVCLIFVLFLNNFCHCRNQFNSINYSPNLNGWSDSDNMASGRFRRWPYNSFRRRGGRSYVLINKDVFAYKPSQYSQWSNWTNCSAADCSQTRYRKCIDNYLNRHRFSFSYRHSCPVKYIMEKRKCSSIPECKLSQNYNSNKPVVDKCGIRPNISENHMLLKITGGKQAKPHSWPWQVALVLKGTTDQRSTKPDRYVCGATLIHPLWVITAAHCLSSLSRYKLPRGEHLDPARYGLNDLVVRMGDHSRTNKEPAEVDRSVSFIVLHPNFKISAFTNIFDVALLKMASPIESGPEISFACLPESNSNLPDNTTCVATGWGHTEPEEKFIQASLHGINLDWIISPFSKTRVHSRGINNKLLPRSHSFQITYNRMALNREQPLHLMEVKVPLIDFYKCRRSLPEFYIDKRLHVCAGEEGKDTCTGDSGGGLYCKAPGTSNWQLYGITSFGSGIDGCGTSAGIYVRVAAVTNWVHKTIFGYKSN